MIKIGKFVICKREEIVQEIENRCALASKIAYNKGYLAGNLQGFTDACCNKYTPNEMREKLGLDPIKQDGDTL